MEYFVTGSLCKSGTDIAGRDKKLRMNELRLVSWSEEELIYELRAGYVDPFLGENQSLGNVLLSCPDSQKSSSSSRRLCEWVQIWVERRLRQDATRGAMNAATAGPKLARRDDRQAQAARDRWTQHSSISVKHTPSRVRGDVESGPVPGFGVGAVCYGGLAQVPSCWVPPAARTWGIAQVIRSRQRSQKGVRFAPCPSDVRCSASPSVGRKH